MGERGKVIEAIIAVIDEIAIVMVAVVLSVWVLYDRGYITLLDAVIIIGFLMSISIIIVYKVIESQKQKVKIGAEAIIGKIGYALDDIEPGGEGYVIVDGEYWNAVNVSARKINKDERIRVVSVKGLLLEVEPENGIG